MFQYDVKLEHGEKVLYINLNQQPEIPLLEENPKLMAFIIDLFSKEKFDKIIIEQYDIFEYSASQIKYLKELASIWNAIQNVFSKLNKLDAAYTERINLLDILKKYPYDPIGTLVELKRYKRKLEVYYEKTKDIELKIGLKELIDLISYIELLFQKTEVYKRIEVYLDGYVPGDRLIYRKLFIPDIKPSFIYLSLIRSIPEEANILESYKVDDAEVIIFSLPYEVSNRYYIFPPEFFLTTEEVNAMLQVRRFLIGYQPKRADYLDPYRLRENFYNLVLNFLKNYPNIRKKLLAKIITRYTIGFGILEYLLKDERVQDILINPPLGKTPIFINHADYEQCITNIYVSPKEAESWATKLRLISGRPFDEANPVLDTEIDLGNVRARVAAVMEPLSPKGLGFALRRHRSRPWTLPLFIENKMLSPLAAGLLSLLVDTGRTILIAGTRGAGKCVSGDTLILNGKGELVKIKDLVEKELEKGKIEIEDGYVTIPKNLYVYGLDLKDLKIKKVKVKAVYKRRGGKLLKIKTKSGFEIKVTPEHPFLVNEKGELKWKRAEELKVGNFVAIARVITEINEEEKLKIAKERIRKAKEILEKLEILANSDLFFDRVEKIEETYEEWVYDLETETENFIANGFIAHNTSLLTALMLEIPRKVRIITIEDVLEIPTDYFRKLGYNILPLKVRSPLSLQTSELSADDGIKVSLRLGDSALIIGEVRSKEAVTLYEAMRVGALANVVMGTIHAESPYGVYDRVVNDLGVPKTSFKATDIIVIANPIKDPSGLRKYRRVLRITEVRKHWEKDPLMEKGFVDLMIYDVDKDELKPTSNLIHGDSEILKSVASRIKVFAGSWEKLWENILLRAEAKKMLVDYAKRTGNRELLEADFVVKANDMLHKIMDEVYQEVGYPEKNECLRRFEEWLRKNI